MTNTTFTTNPNPNPRAGDAPDPKVAAVQRLYEAVGSNDLDAILAELADDVDWAAGAASRSVPWFGPFAGRDAVPGFFDAIGSNIEIAEFVPGPYCWNGTDVMVPVRWSYTVRSTGRRVATTMQHWWRFADGKVVLFRGAEDTEQSAAAFDGERGDAIPSRGEQLAAVPPPAQDNVETVLGLYAALGRGDLDSVLGALAEDVDWASGATSTSAPWYGHYRGAVEVGRFFQAMGAAVQIREFTPLSVTTEGDHVMAVIRWSYTAHDSGRTVTSHLHHWWTVTDGVVTFYRGLDDSELTAATLRT